MTVKAIDPNGLVRDIRSDSSGNLSTTLGTRLAGEDLAVDADIIRTAPTGQVTWVGEALTGHGGFYFIPGRQESPPGEVGNRGDLELSPAGLEVSSLQGVPVRVSYSCG